MKDFENWYNYYITNFGPIDKELALKAYNEYFSCTCETCMYRKEKGFIPLKFREQGCNAPESAEGLLDVVERLFISH